MLQKFSTLVLIFFLLQTPFIKGILSGFGGFSEYTPNTITYQFPEVIEQQIIIAPHTCYYAESDLRDAVAYA
jgi:hypothetical protein